MCLVMFFRFSFERMCVRADAKCVSVIYKHIKLKVCFALTEFLECRKLFATN